MWIVEGDLDWAELSRRGMKGAMHTWLEVKVWARVAPYQDPVATVATTETARRKGRKRGSVRLKGLGEVEMVGDGGGARRAVEDSGGISAGSSQ